MDRIAIHEQQETDEEILNYVRGMQGTAPVTDESLHRYLNRIARRKITERAVGDRLTYLASAGCLDKFSEWDGGQVDRYEITAKGMDILDGKIPPLNWRG